MRGVVNLGLLVWVVMGTGAGELVERGMLFCICGEVS